MLCPGKLLKNQKMVDAHLASNVSPDLQLHWAPPDRVFLSQSHMRAKKRMATRLLDPDSLTSEDPREIVAEIEEQLDSERSAGQKGIAGQGQPKAKDAVSRHCGGVRDGTGIDFSIFRAEICFNQRQARAQPRQQVEAGEQGRPADTGEEGAQGGASRGREGDGSLVQL